MDEPVRWVTKAEAVREMEVSVSTLDRMIRREEIEVPQGGTPGLRADGGA